MRIVGGIFTHTRRNSTVRLDALWSRIVRARADYKCERCGSKGGTHSVQAAHILSRRWKSARWNLENGVSLCAGCHFWAHTHPIAFLDWAEKLRGEDTILRLRTLQGMKTDLLRTELALKTAAKEIDVKI